MSQIIILFQFNNDFFSFSYVILNFGREACKEGYKKEIHEIPQTLNDSNQLNWKIYYPFFHNKMT